MAKKIKIIMSKDVLNLGEEGDICEVAPGYARNYLFPKKLAVIYNQHNINILNQRRRIIEKRKVEKRISAQEMKAKLENEQLLFKMPAGENGKLFGSITNGMVAEELQKRGYAIEKKKIELPEHHIKMIGSYTALVKLYENEQANLKITIEAVEVEKKEEKSVKQQDRGKGKRYLNLKKTEEKKKEKELEMQTENKH